MGALHRKRKIKKIHVQMTTHSQDHEYKAVYTKHNVATSNNHSRTTCIMSVCGEREEEGQGK